ncbi:NADH-quinone oxidoreductase subunit NuoE [Candidatus Blochmannia ocreatus (nom. nud.)]|uniref:NADH-quinone oxidoreductase subunit E n=1 Tax=Candidatus Blochmannia ocreatus (nom. nud.) TaxID=251538 RepID=A0ABY4SSM7_9ENTR|nr:NADH-quinone oxidoreductase subunit NuoE [Candidatus Blochmannia ocreatus]URJ24980.1 NADH-quinone oxidoreductase subunit NuoE [Candidatus Blochmannia ocreatus]
MSNINIYNKKIVRKTSGTHDFQLSTEEHNAIRKECTFYKNNRAASIEALKIVQKNRGWVSDNAIVSIAKILRISTVDLEGVATFYNQIFRQPVGRYIIRYCDSAVCYLTGYENIKNKLINILGGICAGETTADNNFTLLPTCCLGMCDKAPVIMVNQDIYCYVVPETISKLLGKYL